ncbi:helix-turn-helix domain-containing protein [Avibacterium paragallinarum]|uniref:Helix-turn-helix domain containing protein n=1 Tax=Avibacterium paragallinarum TaxID=728 RepID=A0ABU7QI65_AVIPA|nr:helix-turn-helix domain-containing protein [Avibacterium paragallinarum]QZP14821.1 helix-turn-helix domain containing protein [Avibacterium paragallinarum]WAL56754.1 helix-turn-helix domain-containing protein [Avibacterium paragallinarum]WAM59266.1 helix-turn-helix domain-containing protein [Avibacterium paragallinarum]
MNVEEILERLKTLTVSKTNKELAEKLNLSSDKVVSNWKIRNSIPLDILLLIREQYQCNMDWLLFGEQPDTLTTNEKLVLMAFNNLSDRKKVEFMAKIMGLDTKDNSAPIVQTVLGHGNSLVAGVKDK